MGIINCPKCNVRKKGKEGREGGRREGGRDEVTQVGGGKREEEGKRKGD